MNIPIGHTSAEHQVLKQSLNLKGAKLDKTSNVFDEETEAAVRVAQQKLGLEVTGQPTPELILQLRAPELVQPSVPPTVQA